jgi:hypothetical protein
VSAGANTFARGERKVQKIDTTGKFILTELEAKSGVGADDLDGASDFNVEGMRGGLKRDGLDVDAIRGNRFIKTIKDENIGGELILGKIVHAFVKTSMIAIFDLSRGGIAPIDIAKSARTVAQKDTLARGHGVFETREDRFDPDTTAKGAEASQIGFLAIVGKLMSRLVSSTAR